MTQSKVITKRPKEGGGGEEQGVGMGRGEWANRHCGFGHI